MVSGVAGAVQRAQGGAVGGEGLAVVDVVPGRLGRRVRVRVALVDLDGGRVREQRGHAVGVVVVPVRDQGVREGDVFGGEDVLDGRDPCGLSFA